MGRRICGSLFLILALTSQANAEVVYRPLMLWLAREKADGITCVVKLKQIAFAARVWQSEHGGQFPPGFEALTNELSSPALLCCPANHRIPCPESFSEVNWSTLDYEWLTGFDPNDEQSVFSRCRIHGNIARVNGLVERLFDFRDGWPAVIAPAVDALATEGETVRFEIRVAPGTLQPLRFQWETVEFVRTTNVVFVSDPEDPSTGYWKTNIQTDGYGTAIPGAQEAVHTVSNITFADATYYRARMSNSMGVAISSAARLTVVSNLQNPKSDAALASQLCAINLRGIGLAAHMWGNAVERLPASFTAMTNRYGSPMFGWPLILYCPWDTNRVAPEEWENVDLADTSYELMQPIPDWEDFYAPFCRCKVHQYILEAGGYVRSRPILREPHITVTGLFECVVFGPAHYAHVIECSSNLSSWMPVATNVTSAEGTSVFQAPASPDRKFYRAVH